MVATYFFIQDSKGVNSELSKKATLGERSGADSHNSSSEGLPSKSSERLSVSPLTSPKDVAKIVNDTEIIKRSATKILNEGGIRGEVNTPLYYCRSIFSHLVTSVKEN